jgi:hypothetical protein
MKPALLQEIEQIRKLYPRMKEKHGAEMAKEMLAEKFECSVERIRQIVVLKSRPYESRYRPCKKAAIG